MPSSGDSRPRTVLADDAEGGNAVRYGDTARIGLIYMHSSIVMECEFWAMVPTGVSVHVTRTALPTVTVNGLDEMVREGEIERCASLLAAAPVDVIAYGGTSASFLHGLGWDEAIAERVRLTSGGRPATTTSSASLRSLRAVGAQTIAIATPYIAEINDRAVQFFATNGFEVVAVEGLGLESDHDIGAVESQRVLELAESVDQPAADAVFISCTNFRTANVIVPLEERLNKPVVSANQATLWDCLRIVGVEREMARFGSLFGARR